jgi:hypothetical protein
MFWQKTQMDEVIDNKEQAVKDGNNKTKLNDPGKV